MRRDFESRATELATLQPHEYDQQRKEAAKELSVTVRTLDRAVTQLRKQKGRSSSAEFVFEELEPWRQPVNGAELLDRLSAVFRRFVVLGEREADAAALWVLKTYCFEGFNTSPILAIESATPRCGKTTMLSVTAAVVYRAVTASNISSAALFRFIDAHHPTMLLDEADTWAKTDENIRGILNSGHTRSGAYVIRCQGEGEDLETRRFSTWCPKLVALIGRLPATLQDRSIVVLLRRKLPSEPVERYRPDRPPAEFLELRRRCLRWAEDHFAALRECDPEMPTRLNDRACDNWRPLMALATAAGGEWSVRARDAALALSGVERDVTNLVELLLADIAAQFDSRSIDRMRSQDLADHLANLTDRPWSEFNRGRPITTNQLARQLDTLDVKPKKIRFGEATAQGYERAWFNDAFARYLPFPTGTPEQTKLFSELGAKQTGTRLPDVPARNAGNSMIHLDCSGVPLQKEGVARARNLANCASCQNFKRLDGETGECEEGLPVGIPDEPRECVQFLAAHPEQPNFDTAVNRDDRNGTPVRSM